MSVGKIPCDAAFRRSVLLEQPFARAAKLQPGAVDDQMQFACSRTRPALNRQSTSPTTERRMIGNGKINPQQPHDRGDQPFALAQSQSKNSSQSQCRLNGQIGIMRLAARRCSRLRLPTHQRFFGEPDRQASTIAKRCVIVPPIGHPMPLTGNVASTLGVKFERHDRSRWSR